MKKTKKPKKQTEVKVKIKGTAAGVRAAAKRISGGNFDKV